MNVKTTVKKIKFEKDYALNYYFNPLYTPGFRLTTIQNEMYLIIIFRLTPIFKPTSRILPLLPLELELELLGDEKLFFDDEIDS